MAGTISAPVRGATRNRRRLIVSYLIGTMLGGIGTALLLSLIGSVGFSGMMGAARLPLILTVAFLATFYANSSRWPELNQQIPQWWILPPSVWGFFSAGVVFGSGLFNQITHPVFHIYLVLLATLGSLEPLLAAAIGLSYGLLAGIWPILSAFSPSLIQLGPQGAAAVRRVSHLARAFAAILFLTAGGIALTGLTAL